MLTSGQTITTITVNTPVLNIQQLPSLDAWLRSILWDSKIPETDVETDSSDGFEIHRLKARLPLSDGSVKIVQGVREVFEILDAPNQNLSVDEKIAPLKGKIVLIGRNLSKHNFEESFLNAIKSL
jgi:hypothetical protein